MSILAISMSIFLFAGCQSSNNNTASAQTSNSTTQNTNRPSAEQMKKRIQDSIQPLVTAGTITQAQADKIVEAYTTRPAGNGEKKKAQDNGQNSGQNNQQNSTQNSGQNNGQGNGQNRQRNNPLSKLVSDGTITQAQADAVAQKIKENNTHKNNGQSSN